MSDADKPEGLPEGEREPENETTATEEVGFVLRALETRAVI
jgi:hypothetical protein